MEIKPKEAHPTNSLVGPLMTDLYQITMCYGYWKSGRHNEYAIFDLFFRKNPFHGEYTIFAGLEEVLGFLNAFHFSNHDILYLKSILPHIENEFFNWLATLTTESLKVYAVKEGTIVFPRLPVLRIEGPLGLGQLLETTLLNLLNYASLIATNAARFRLAAGPSAKLLEFGLRRAQGPDGALSASRYAYMAGFDGTSNVLAGKLHGIPVQGTHAHAYIQSYTSLKELNPSIILPNQNTILDKVLRYRNELEYGNTNEGELAAFISYACAFPQRFVALVDTYDTLLSGVLNFICVALALLECDYEPVGIRLDSGDIVYLSVECRKRFKFVAEKYNQPTFANLLILASNEIDETVLNSIHEQKHEINGYGIGTNLVTCNAQPALGMVYKLVQINNVPRIKISEEITKITIPGSKSIYRFFGENNTALLDVLMMTDEKPPKEGERMLCRHPFLDRKRVYAIPTKVVNLHELVFANGKIVCEMPTLEERKLYVQEQFKTLRSDITRPVNPTPYKVSVSERLHSFIGELWMNEVPIHEMS